MSVKIIIIIGVGSVVSVILGRFVVIPTRIPNTNPGISYPLLALVSVTSGPVAGGLIGLIGHTLKDLTMYGSAWWSWIIRSGIIGIIFGLAGHKMNPRHDEFTTNSTVHLNIFQAFGNIVVQGLVTLGLDILIYSKSTGKVFIRGVLATVLNIVAVGIIGTSSMKTYVSTRTKRGSLSKD